MKLRNETKKINITTPKNLKTSFLKKIDVYFRLFLNTILKKEITLFSKTSLSVLCLAVFASVVFISLFSGNFLFFKTKVPDSKIIKNTFVRQTSSIVASQPVKWTTLVRRNEIKDSQNLVQLPKTARNIKIKTITEKEAEQILFQQKSDPLKQLTLEERKKLASSSIRPSVWMASLFLGINKFFLASAEDALDQIDQVVETVTQDVVITEDAKFVDVSEQVFAEPEIVEEVEIEEITSEPEVVEEVETEEVASELEVVEEAPEPEIISEPEIIPEVVEESIETVSPSDQEIVAPEPEVVEEVVEKEYVEIDYETPAPQIIEEETDKGKLVTISSKDEILQEPLTDVVAFTTIPEIYKVGQENKIKIKWQNNGDQEMEFHAYDLNGNGKLDYVEWTVPHLSEQIFEIIFISKAFRLDVDKNIIEDIYDYLRYQDDDWVSMENNQYVRVTFEQILDNTKDNTIYAKPTNLDSPAVIEVYPVYTDAEGNNVEGPRVATFDNIDTEGVFKVLLTNLQTPTKVFDFKIVGHVDIDYIVDPAITWDGEGTDETCGGSVGDGNKWSCAVNWSTNTVPGATDVVTFDGTNTKDVTINANVNVAGIVIASGYTGTITQTSTYTITVGSSGFLQSDGAFVGSSGGATIDLNGIFTLDGGSFTSTNGTFSISSTFTISGSPTFVHNSGTVQFDSSTTATITPATETFYKVSFTAGTKTIADSNTLTVTNTLTLTDGLINQTTIPAGGSVEAQGNINQASTFDGGNALILINGTTDQTLTGSCTQTAGRLPKIEISKASGTFYLSGTIRTNQNWTYTQGTFDATTNDSTMVFASYGATIAVITGSHSLNNVIFDPNADSSAGSTLTITAGTTLTVLGDLTFDNTNSAVPIINTGTIVTKKDIVVGNNIFTGTAKILIDGTVDQALSGSGGGIFNVEIDKASGTLTTSGTLVIAGDWIQTNGTVDNSGLTTATFRAMPSSDSTISGSPTFNDVVFDTNDNRATCLSWEYNIVGTMNVLGSFTQTEGCIQGDNIAVKGNLSINSKADGGTATVIINGTTDQTFTGSCTQTVGGITNIEISKISGTLYLSGTIRTIQNWTYTQGTVDATTNNSTVVFVPASTLPVITGSHTLDNVIIDSYTTTTRTLALSDGTTLTVAGDFMIDNTSAGNITINTGIISVEGSVLIGTGLTAYSGSTILTFSGSNNQTLTLASAGLLDLDVKINKSGGALDLNSTFTLNATNQDLIIEEGTFDLNNHTLSVSGTGSTFVVQDGGTLQLLGGETTTTPTLQSGSTVIYDGTGSTLQDWTYHHLTINGSGTFTFGVNESLGGNFLLSAGTVDFNGKTVATTGDFTIDTNGQIISDVDAMDGTTINVGGNFSASGTEGDLLTFNASSAWYLNVTGTANASYVDVAYSDASGGTPISTANCTNSGNNINWLLNIAPTLTSVSDSPDPIKGGDEITITPTGQGDADSDNLYFYCNETGTATSADTLCSQANASYSSDYSSMTCTYNVSTGDTTRTVYCRVYDGSDYTAEKTSTYVVDSTLPTPSSFDPASGSTITSTTQIITFTTDENADCRASRLDDSYDDMSDDVDCTGDGTTSQSCSIENISGSTLDLYIACRDTVGNKDTNATNEELSYVVDIPVASSSVGGNSYAPILATGTPSVPEQIMSIPEKVADKIAEILQQINLSFIPQKEEISEKTPEIVIPKETPEAFKNLDIMDVFPKNDLGILSIDSDINFFSEKIPQFENVLKDLGVIDLNNTKALSGLDLILPSLTSLALQDTNLDTVSFQSIPAIPLSELSDIAKQQIPTDIVFTRSEKGLIDYNTSLSFNEQGAIQQKISTIVGETIELVIKPDNPAKRVLGYITFKNREVSEQQGFFSLFKKYFSAALTGNSAQTTEDSVDGLLLQKFEYNLVDQGIFRAVISAPLVKGEYDITTVIEYKDENLLPKQTNLVAVVDPEGYVFTKIAGMEARTSDATVSIYWLNPEKDEYELWPADKYLQINPQITGSTGEYSFLVPEGKYYLSVEAKGYNDYKSEIFSVNQGNGIHKNIELQKKFMWKDLIDWRVGLGLLLTIAIIFIVYQSIIMRKLVIKNTK